MTSSLDIEAILDPFAGDSNTRHLLRHLLICSGVMVVSRHGRNVGIQMQSLSRNTRKSVPRLPGELRTYDSQY